MFITIQLNLKLKQREHIKHYKRILYCDKTTLNKRRVFIGDVPELGLNGRVRVSANIYKVLLSWAESCAR